jgi:methyl-accepting chemotaxis protein
VWDKFKTNNYYRLVIVAITLLLAASVGYWLYYTNSRAKADYHDVNQSVELIENRIQRTEKRLSDGTAEIDNAQAGLKRADATVRDVTNTARRNAAIINECEDINDRSTARIERIESIIRRVEEQNKEVGTQTSSHT